MCFALFMVMLDNTVTNVALPSIQRDFGASLSALEWTINAYTLTFAVLLVTGGRLGDIFVRRRVGDDRRRARRGHAGRLPRASGRRRRADDAGDAEHHHQRLPAPRAGQ